MARIESDSKQVASVQNDVGDSKGGRADARKGEKGRVDEKKGVERL